MSSGSFPVDPPPDLSSVQTNPAVFETSWSSVLYSLELGSLTLAGGCPAVNRKTKTFERAPTLESKGQGLPLYGTGGAFLYLRFAKIFG